jgi:hypothetical protein
MRILIFCLLFPSVITAQSIQDFYKVFEHTYRKSLEISEMNQVEVDEKNAFIKIYNPLMPADAVSFTYFVKEDKSKVFGFQYVSAHVDRVLAVPRTEFYEYKDNTWREVSGEVLPKLGFVAFWGDQALPPQSLQELNLWLVLPQVGTTVLAKSSEALSFQFPYDNMPKDYIETFDKRKYKTMELNWNVKIGKFVIGKKY